MANYFMLYCGKTDVLCGFSAASATIWFSWRCRARSNLHNCF